MRVNYQVYFIAFTFFGVTLLFGGLQYFFSLFSSSDRSSGNFVFQITSLFFYLIASFHVVKCKEYSLTRFFFNAYPLILLIFLCVISTLWSIESETSFRRSIALVLSSIFCLYLAQNMSIKQYAKLIWLSCFVVCFLGFIAAWIPSVGKDPTNWQYPDAWRGLTGNKTDFGRISSIAIILSVFLFYIKEISKLSFFISFSLFFVCLTKSEATTPLILAFLCSMLIIPFERLVGVNSSKKSIFIVFLIFLSVAISTKLVVDNFIFITDYIGKDSTLTGRTFIWEYALITSDDFRAFGSGYRAFWIDKLTYDFYYYNPYWGEELMNNGHSGYVDVLVELGIIGLMLYILFILSYMSKMIIRSKSVSSSEQALGLSLLFFYVIYSVTEQITLEQSELLWMTLSFIYFRLNVSKKNA